MNIVTISEEAYDKHRISEDGICVECYTVSVGGITPTTPNKLCGCCGCKLVMSYERALFHGYIGIMEDVVK